MKNKKVISVLVIIVAIMAVIAASSGIFSHGGNGPYEYQSIRGKTVTIYGDGLYRHMSSDVASMLSHVNGDTCFSDFAYDCPYCKNNCHGNNRCQCHSCSFYHTSDTNYFNNMLTAVAKKYQ